MSKLDMFNRRMYMYPHRSFLCRCFLRMIRIRWARSDFRVASMDIRTPDRFKRRVIVTESLTISGFDWSPRRSNTDSYHSGLRWWRFHQNAIFMFQNSFVWNVTSEMWPAVIISSSLLQNTTIECHDRFCVLSFCIYSFYWLYWHKIKLKNAFYEVKCLKNDFISPLFVI